MNKKEFDDSFELLKKLGAHPFQESTYTLGEGIRILYYTEDHIRDNSVIQLVFGVGGIDERIAKRIGEIYGLNYDLYCVFSAEDVAPKDEIWVKVLSIDCTSKNEVEPNYAKIKEVYDKLNIATEKWERKKEEAVDEFLKREGIIT